MQIISIARSIVTTLRRHEKFLAILSILSYLAALVAYFLGQISQHWICADVIYTSAFSSCSDQITNNAHTAEIWTISFMFAIPLLFITIEPLVRKVFLRFLKFYIPIAILIAVAGAFGKSCLMWSCSSLLRPALVLDFYIFAAFFLAIGWGVLAGNRWIVIIILPLAVWFMTSQVMSFSDANRHNSSIFTNTREKDHSFFEKLQCDNIVSADMKEECAAFVQRNKAVDAMDLKGCESITLSVQRYMCQKLILERQQLNQKYGAQ